MEGRLSMGEWRRSEREGGRMGKPAKPTLIREEDWNRYVDAVRREERQRAKKQKPNPKKP